MYTTESKWGKSFNSLSRTFFPPDTTALAAAMGAVLVPFKLGPGAMGARWSGNNGFFGSTRANRTAANPATRNWGMTMKMLWIPFVDKRNEDEKGYHKSVEVKGDSQG